MNNMHTIGKHATTVSTINGETRVTYHSTPVVVFNSLWLWLNSGGWQTATTKTRMNQASNQFGLQYRVYQKDFSWFVEIGSGEGCARFHYIFGDGMRINRDDLSVRDVYGFPMSPYKIER